MSLARCHSCRREIPTEGGNCPHCGFQNGKKCGRCRKEYVGSGLFCDACIEANRQKGGKANGQANGHQAHGHTPHERDRVASAALAAAPTFVVEELPLPGRKREAMALESSRKPDDISGILLDYLFPAFFLCSFCCAALVFIGLI